MLLPCFGVSRCLQPPSPVATQPSEPRRSAEGSRNYTETSATPCPWLAATLLLPLSPRPSPEPGAALAPSPPPLGHLPPALGRATRPTGGLRRGSRAGERREAVCRGSRAGQHHGPGCKSPWGSGGRRPVPSRSPSPEQGPPARPGGKGGCRVERSSSVSARPVPSLHQPETMMMTVVGMKR